MDIFSFFTREKKSKDVAKDRLKLVLIHDRVDFSSEKLEAIKKDLIEVLEKYVEVDSNNIEINIVNSKDSDARYTSAHISTSIPIKKVKK